MTQVSNNFGGGSAADRRPTRGNHPRPLLMNRRRPRTPQRTPPHWRRAGNAVTPGVAARRERHALAGASCVCFHSARARFLWSSPK